MFLLAFGLKDPLFFFKSHGLTNEQRNGITAERENKVRLISGMVEQRKHLEKDVLLKRKVLAEKKKGFQEILKRKKKIDMPVTADLENILNSYIIMAAAYHGGKLNGVDCHELI